MSFIKSTLQDVSNQEESGIQECLLQTNVFMTTLLEESKAISAAAATTTTTFLQPQHTGPSFKDNYKTCVQLTTQ